jgi:hypothetical protein
MPNGNESRKNGTTLIDVKRPNPAVTDFKSIGPYIYKMMNDVDLGVAAQDTIDNQVALGKLAVDHNNSLIKQEELSIKIQQLRLKEQENERKRLTASGEQHNEQPHSEEVA